MTIIPNEAEREVGVKKQFLPQAMGGRRQNFIYTFHFPIRLPFRFSFRESGKDKGAQEEEEKKFCV